MIAAPVLSGEEHIAMEKRLWQILSQTNEWVRYSDGKAVALLGIQGVLVGLVLAFTKDLCTGVSLTAVSNIFLFAGLVFIASSMVCTFLCLIPRLKNGDRKSPVFFGSVAADFKTPKEYIEYLGQNFSTEENVSESLAEQVHTNSRIASLKFTWVTWSTRLTLIGLAFWTVFVAIALFGGK